MKRSASMSLARIGSLTSSPKPRASAVRWRRTRVLRKRLICRGLPLAPLARIGPIWSLSAIPARIRGAIAVMLTLTLLPLIPDAALPTEAAGLVGPLAGELLLGTVIGLGAVVFVHGVTIAAEVIALQMGLSLGAALGGTEDMGDPGIGQLEVRFALVGISPHSGPGPPTPRSSRAMHWPMPRRYAVGRPSRSCRNQMPMPWPSKPATIPATV